MIARYRSLAFFSTILGCLILAFSVAEIAFSQDQREKPLTFRQILTGLQTQGKTEETKTLEARINYIIQRIRERGIDFELDQDGENELLDAGANEDLINAIRRFAAVKEVKISQKKTIKAKDKSFVYLNRAQQCGEKDSFCRLANFTRAIEADSNFALAYLYRGIENARLGKLDEAVQDYNKVIELAPEEGFAYNNRGLIFAKMGNYNRAISDYNQAIELLPTFANGYKNRGNAFFNLSKFDRAIEDYDTAIAFEPRNAEFLLLRAHAFFSKGEFQRAIFDYSKAIKFNPENAEAYEFRGYSYEQIGDRYKAKIDIQKAEEITNP